jgi:nucleoside-diphosphate-sugar epimerase
VTGATGFVGGRVVERLAADGHEVLAFGRRPVEQFPQREVAAYRQWDVTRGPIDMSGPVDAAVHCAAHVADWGPAQHFMAVNVNGTRAALETFRHAGLFIHVSTSSVYGTDRPHHLIREDAPLPAGYPDAYSRTKALAERLVAAAGRDTVILRPHAVYGPGDPTLLPRLLTARRFGCQLAVGTGRNRVSLTHVDNLARAVVCALGGTFRCEVFNIADAEPVTVDAVLRELLAALGLPSRVCYIPAALARPLATLLEAAYRAVGVQHPPLLTRYVVAQLAGEFTMDMSKARARLGYEPVESYRSALPAIAAWWKASAGR